MIARVLHTENLSKFFDKTKAISNVNFSINKGEIRAIIGANGAGKSTFVKMLYGEIIPDEGAIYIKGKPVKFSTPKDALKNGISMVPQDFGLIDTMSIAENLSLINRNLLFYDQKQSDIQTKLVLKKLSIAINPNKVVNELSVSEKQLVSIAKALNTNSEIIIFDEPTSVLNVNSFFVIKEIIKDLKESNKTIIYITHKLDEIFEIADTVSVFLNSEMVLTTTIKSINQKDLLKYYNISNKNGAEIRKDSKNVPLLIVENLTTDNLDNISFVVNKGESIGIISNNYPETIELASSMFGIEKMKSGSIRINGNLLENPYTCVYSKVGFIPEDRRKDGVFNLLNIHDNLSILNLKKHSKYGFLNKNTLLKITQRHIEDLKIKCHSFLQSISELSGGNQQKVLLARWITYDFELLILLEPTAGIDLGGKSEIHLIISDLKKKGKSFLIVSSDIEELKLISDKILLLENGKFKSFE